MSNDEARVGPVVREHRKTFDLEERTAKFGEAVIRFCRELKLDAVTDPLVRQVIKSATSVGANYCEADDAVSRKEFRQKIGTCKKESRETKHWLRMIAAAEPGQSDKARTLWKEANELLLIFATIFRKLTEKRSPASGKAP
jgi:four helix bundle protein